jgi:hypothetical protein
MKLLQAATRDRSAKNRTAGREMYRVGSYFKGCHHCGEVEWVTAPSGREVKRYLTGHQVFRCYVPSRLGWTYWCYECGAKDGACWEDAQDIGADAIVGCRGAVAARKMVLRKERVKLESRAVAPTKASRVAELEAELARLMAVLAKGGK